MLHVSWFLLWFAQADDVEMKDKDVQHPEDHHDQHEFLAQSRIVAPPYFEPCFGMDVYIQKLDNRGQSCLHGGDCWEGGGSQYLYCILVLTYM